jgi:integrase/recombinase XerD
LVYYDIVRRNGKEVSITIDLHGVCVHSLPAISVTTALAHGADIAKVQEWLEHANVSTTRIYDKRRMRPEESPTLKWSIEPRRRSSMAEQVMKFPSTRRRG